MILPILISIKFQYLSKKKLVLLKHEVEPIKPRKSYMDDAHLEEERTYLENVFFIDRETMNDKYKRILFIKLLIYTSIFLFGIWNTVYFRTYVDFFIYFKILFLLGITWEIKVVFCLYSRVKNEDYEVERVVIDEVDYYTGYIGIKMEKQVKSVKLMDAVM